MGWSTWIPKGRPEAGLSGRPAALARRPAVGRLDGA